MSDEAACKCCHQFAFPDIYNRHIILRWCLGIVVLMLVFWLGLKVGEFKELVNTGFNFNMPMYNRMYISRQQPMMYQYWQNLPTNESSPSLVRPRDGLNNVPYQP